MFRRLTAIAALLIAGQTYAQSFIADTIPYALKLKLPTASAKNAPI
ncbi:hypothetical protein [Eikenella sp. NML03-A-027]|nr:hypothetical protein [Eikenella sp. NML03-A-027]